MTIFTPGNRPAMEWLFLDVDTPVDRLAPWLAATLPHCAWSSHVVIVGQDPDGRLLDTVVDFLDGEEIALVHLHQFVDGGLGPAPEAERLADAAERFQTEAYRERTGARLVTLPILEVPPGVDPRPAVQTAGELTARLAKPSLLLWDEPDATVITTAAGLGLRLHLGSTTRNETAMEIITAAHVLDSAMDRMEETGPILIPCRPHAVVAGGRIFGCAQEWRLGRPAGDPAGDRRPEWNPDASLCAGCLADTIAGMGASLAANLRRTEGRELALRASTALVDSGAHSAAAEVAQIAADLSQTDPERVDALIQAALCRLAEGRLQDADQTLLDAAASEAPAGLIAYHRARIQVAWRDDIEALDRFAEALETGTEAVSEEDLHFEMAMSHIRIEEWVDARTHLEQAGGPSPAIAFNLGVCDLNDGLAERALGHFDRSLDLDPSSDDLGRIRFFRGFCLKELSRYEEAAEDLRLAIDLEEPELAHHNTLGFCLFKLGRYAEAVASFQNAVAVDPTSAIDWANIGVNLERMGERDRAAELYSKALAMDGSIGFAREGLERVGG